MPVRRPQLIGREAELVVLRGQLEAAQEGAGSLILIAGEPGIGKSRLLQQIAEDAQARGIRVLWGRCFDGEGSPAFWPWIQVLRTYCRDCDPALLVQQLGDGAPTISALDLELRRLLSALPVSEEPGTAAPLPAGPTQVRFRLFEAVSNWLLAAGRAAPLLLLFDDLHWADAPSLLLLRFVMRVLRDARVLVAGSYRDTEAGSNEPLCLLAAEVAQAGPVNLLAIRGLNEVEAKRFLETTFEPPPSAALVRAVCGRTEGNPFFMSEVMRLLAAEGRLHAPSWAGEDGHGGGQPLPLSAGTRAVIDRRLERLPPECLQVLMVAAVAGREFGLATLRRVPEIAALPLLELLERAEEALVLVRVQDALGRYRFAHALIREALYARLGSAGRARLHGQVGSALERFYALDPDSHLAELAHHFALAATEGETGRAVGYARRAAVHAVAQLAYEEGIRLYWLALDVLELEHVPDEHSRCELLLALADAQIRAGELAAAEGAANRALAIARALGDAELVARAVLALGERWGDDYGRNDPAALALLQEALHALADGAVHLRVRLLVRQGRLLMFAGECERAVAVSRTAIAAARAAGEPATLLHVLGRAQWQLAVAQRPEERLAAADEVIALAGQLGDSGMLLEGRQYRLCAALDLGDIATVDAELDQYERLARALRQPLYLWMAGSYRAMRALLAGHFAEAERLARAAVAVTAGAELPETGQVLAAQLGLSWWFQGRAALMVEPTRSLCRRNPEVVAWRAMLGLLYCETGETGAARTILSELAAGGFAGLPRDTGWWAALAFLAEVCSSLDAVEEAARLYELLLPYEGRVLAGPFAVFCLAPCSYYLGLLAAVLQRYEEAERHFEAGSQLCQAIGAPAWLARLHLARVRMELATSSITGDVSRRARAVARARAARALAETFGMERLHREAGELCEQLDREPEPPAAIGFGQNALTAREREVLRLLAQGFSNREIADHLVLSVNTVTRHLANIYGKLGLRSRSEATAYVFRRGLE